MAGERHDHDERITDAIRDLAGDDRGLDAPPPELWRRIAGALDEDDPVGAPAPPAPPDLWDRIAAEVHDLGGRTEATTGRPDAPVTSIPSPRRSHRSRWVPAVAAAVLLVVGVAVVALGRDDPTPTVEVVARAALSGEGLDPGGAGTGAARLEREGDTWEVAIRASGLPAPAEGTYYEAWLLGSGPDQVQSLGALEGSGGFAVPIGLDLDDFPLVDVSIEPIDGNPAHSSKSVLRGRLEPS